MQRVHCDSGTACSAHQSSCEPGFTPAGAWPDAAGPVGAVPGFWVVVAAGRGSSFEQPAVMERASEINRIDRASMVETPRA